MSNTKYTHALAEKMSENKMSHLGKFWFTKVVVVRGETYTKPVEKGSEPLDALSCTGRHRKRFKSEQGRSSSHHEICQFYLNKKNWLS